MAEAILEAHREANGGESEGLVLGLEGGHSMVLASRVGREV